ncbi:MAG: glycosyltransferase family 2 protein [Ignavibacteria bacterium]|nr:glycosyltransferase family 2 protein [Ignavibacteria bacterium]
MKISVIISTFNRATIIPMCLDSLIKQNYPKEDYEILVVNNNSSDNTEDVVEKYINEYSEVNIRYYFVPKSGQVYARQIGILASRYDVLSFTDDDGVLSPDWLSEISKVFKMNEKVAGVAGKIIIRWDETPPDWIYEYEEQLGKLDYGDEIKFETGLYMNAGNLSIKKDILIETGFNPDLIGPWLIGDGESGLWKRLTSKGYLIGWAPKAVMEHYQIVKKNATTEDIKRRFMNNGICIPYNIYAIDKEGDPALVKNMLKAIFQSLKWSLRRGKAVARGNKKNLNYAAFRTAFYTAQIKYTIKLFFNREFRNTLTKNDWLIKNQNGKSSL